MNIRVVKNYGMLVIVGFCLLIDMNASTAAPAKTKCPCDFSSLTLQSTTWTATPSKIKVSETCALTNNNTVQKLRSEVRIDGPNAGKICRANIDGKLKLDHSGISDAQLNACAKELDAFANTLNAQEGITVSDVRTATCAQESVATRDPPDRSIADIKPIKCPDPSSNWKITPQRPNEYFSSNATVSVTVPGDPLTVFNGIAKVKNPKWQDIGRFRSARFKRIYDDQVVPPKTPISRYHSAPFLCGYGEEGKVGFARIYRISDNQELMRNFAAFKLVGPQLVQDNGGGPARKTSCGIAPLQRHPSVCWSTSGMARMASQQLRKTLSKTP